MRTKSSARRRTILDTAATAFSEMGVEETSMSDIVARLGGSKSTIYSYFASKEELVAAVMQEAIIGRLQDLFNCFDAVADPLDALQGFGRAYLRTMLEPVMVGLTRVALQHGDRAGLGRAFFDNGPRIGWTLMAGHLARWMDDGRLRRDDAGHAAAHLKGLLQAEWLERALYGYPPPEPALIEQAADRAIAVFLRAYGPTG